jgi:hypothetical protein
MKRARTRSQGFGAAAPGSRFCRWACETQMSSGLRLSPGPCGWLACGGRGSRADLSHAGGPPDVFLAGYGLFHLKGDLL